MISPKSKPLFFVGSLFVAYILPAIAPFVCFSADDTGGSAPVTPGLAYVLLLFDEPLALDGASALYNEESYAPWPYTIAKYMLDKIEVLIIPINLTIYGL